MSSNALLLVLATLVLTGLAIQPVAAAEASPPDPGIALVADADVEDKDEAAAAPVLAPDGTGSPALAHAAQRGTTGRAAPALRPPRRKSPT